MNIAMNPSAPDAAALNVIRHSIDLVTVEGNLKVKNYKPKDVGLNIRKTLRGAVDSQSDDGEAVKLGEAIQTDNPVSRLTWEITLKPGEERIVT
jgi:hypothetical protein